MYRQYKTRLVIIVGVITVATVGAILYTNIQNSQKGVGGQDDIRRTAPVLRTATEVSPLLVETSDALNRYVNSLTSQNTVAESDIHLPESIDWNGEFLVALRFSSLAARAFMGAQIEEVNGEKSYVIDLQDAPQGCPASDVNTIRIAFVKQTSKDATLPVIIRITANTASCPL